MMHDQLHTSRQNIQQERALLMYITVYAKGNVMMEEFKLTIQAD